MALMGKPKLNPNLLDIIDTWMKKELPKAQYDVVVPLQTLMPKFKRITILKKVGKTTRPCFMVELHPSTNPAVGDVGYMVIKPDWSSTLSEEATIKHDRVIWGKWNEGAEVMAADPEFFQKMTLYMTIAARVVTMGDFNPNFPEGPHGLEL
jgi:hypothetical protein